MKNLGIDYWVCSSSDIHESEYVSDYDKCIAYFTGFTGESAILVVSQDEANLWTDGRFFIQGEKELKGTCITLMKTGEKNVPTVKAFLAKRLTANAVLSWYSPFANTPLAGAFDRMLSGIDCVKKTDIDLADMCWKKRPARPAEKILIHDEKYAGESSASKLARVRKELSKQKKDCLFVKKLDDIAWITNLRGGDIECNPVFLSFLFISKDNAILFAQEKALSAKVKKHLRDNGFAYTDYDKFFEFVSELDKNAKIDTTIISDLKAVKSKAEITAMKNCHIRDGVYVTKFIYWLKNEIAAGKKLTEIDAAAKLESLRMADKLNRGLSFPTIAAYGPNGAIIHYTPTVRTNAKIKPEGFLLVDSGGQYLDGTTDITRTISVGKLTPEMKCDYTLVTVGMLRLMNARFPKSATSVSLDAYARGPLWDFGLDYKHGTGHGVGFYNCVHEDPVRIRFKNAEKDPLFTPGMITSDEPGVYIEGKYGIRTENMILCVADKEKDFLRFESLTFAPLDKDAIDTAYMTDTDILLYNIYQEAVYRNISPYLNQKEKEWLDEETMSI